jgi:hypothetical protein
LLGLQVQTTNPDFNVLIFEHRCGSSISILTPRLRHLLPEPELAEPPALLMGTEQCRGHCRSLADLKACEAPCSNARDRTLILLIQLLEERSKKVCEPRVKAALYGCSDEIVISSTRLWREKSAFLVAPAESRLLPFGRVGMTMAPSE